MSEWRNLENKNVNNLCNYVWLKYLLPSVGTTLALFPVIGFFPNDVICDDRDVRGAGNDGSLGKGYSEWEGKMNCPSKGSKNHFRWKRWQ